MWSVRVQSGSTRASAIAYARLNQLLTVLLIARSSRSTPRAIFFRSFFFSSFFFFLLLLPLMSPENSASGVE